MRTPSALALLLLVSTAGCGSIAVAPSDGGPDAAAGPDAALPDGGASGSSTSGAGATWDSPSALWDVSSWN